MPNKSRKTASAALTLPKMTTSALMGKQSVRTSFRLSGACIHAINIVSTQLGLKHRSLFDYLVEDTDALKTIAEDIVKDDDNQGKKIQKSYIISREILETIDDMCDNLSISRDTLIEHSVRRLLPIIEREIESHRKRKEMLALVENHYKESRNVLKQIKEGVGEEDPIYKIYQNTVTACKQVKSQVKDIISKGKVTEGFNPKALFPED
jgi:hypothetical protein